MEPRALPAETVGGLRPPAEGFPYFAHADRFAFEPRAESHSHVNSWWLADASFLVYGTSDFIEQAIDQSPLRKQGFQVDWLGTPSDNRGMLLHNDETFVVVFRGTRHETVRGSGQLSPSLLLAGGASVPATRPWRLGFWRVAGGPEQLSPAEMCI